MQIREHARPWILLEVTNRCNRACVYCYASGRSRGEDVSPDRVDAMLDRFGTQAAPLGITLIGGEPLLLPELEDVVRRIRRRGILAAISTNGLSLTPDKVASLVQAGCTSFEVSFDSLDPTVRTALTGAPAAPRQLALAHIVRMGATLTLGAMLTRHNLAELDKLLRVAFALGAHRVSLNQMAPVGSARDHTALAPLDLELMTALEQASACARALGLRVGIGLPVEPCRLPHARHLGLELEACCCARGKWLLESNGDVRVCELAPHPIGNLFQASWDDLASSEAARAFREQVRSVRCLDCGDWDMCHGGCRFGTVRNS